MAITEPLGARHAIIYAFCLRKVFELTADAADERNTGHWYACFLANFALKVSKRRLDVINFEREVTCKFVNRRIIEGNDVVLCLIGIIIQYHYILVLFLRDVIIPRPYTIVSQVWIEIFEVAFFVFYFYHEFFV